MRDSELLKIHDDYVKQLKSKMNSVEKRLEKNSRIIPAGTLKYHRSKSGKFYYSLVTDKGKSEKYLRKENRSVATIVAQKEYDSAFLKNAELLIKNFADFDSMIEINGIESIYDNTTEAKKPLITPAIPDIEKLAIEWESYEYEKKPIGEDVPNYITKKKEHVRSKSELLIADALYTHNIPYRYECPIEICGRIIHPDFTVFDRRNGKNIYWEHLGMLDDYAYRIEALKRIANYEKEGIFSGSEIIYTLESTMVPLTPPVIENKIKKYLM